MWTPSEQGGRHHLKRMGAMMEYHHKRQHTGSECVGTNTYESMYEKHMPERSMVYIADRYISM